MEFPPRTMYCPGINVKVASIRGVAIMDYGHEKSYSAIISIRKMSFHLPTLTLSISGCICRFQWWGTFASIRYRSFNFHINVFRACMYQKSLHELNGHRDKQFPDEKI